MATATCQYCFDPAEWSRNNGQPSPVKRTWSCPRSAVEGTDRCPFHLPPAKREEHGIDPETVVRKLRSELQSDDDAMTFLGATFDDVDLSTTVIDKETNDPIDLRHATIRGDFDIVGTTVHQPLLIGQTDIEGEVNFSNARFSHPVHCDGLTVAGQALFENVTFGNNVVFRNVRFRDAVSFEGTNFDRDADFYRLRAEGKAIFQNTGWKMNCRFQMATFEGRADFYSSSFQRRTDFRSVTFGGVARYSKSTFEKEALFLGADFTREALFKKIEFASNAYFQNATFSDEASFSETTFRGKTKFQFATFDGEAALSYATFQGNVYFHHAQFNSYAEFFECIFEQIADFRWAQFHDVGRFMDAEFEVEAYLSRARFLDVADFRDAYFDHSAIFRKTSFFHAPLFRRAEINAVNFVDLDTESAELTIDFEAGIIRKGRIEQTNGVEVYYNFREAELGDVSIDIETSGRLFENLLISRTDFDRFDFSRYRYALSPEWNVHSFTGQRELDYETEASRFQLGQRDEAETAVGDRDDDAGESANGSDADGFSFPDISGRVSKAVRSVRTRLGVPDSIEDAPSLETTYLKAKNGADEVGDSRAASAFFVREMYYRRYTHLKRAVAPSEKLSTRIRSSVLATMNWLLSISCGYGEKPYRTLSFSVFIVGFYSLVYWLILEMPPIDSPLENVLFSFQSFTALVVGVNTEPLGFWASLVATSQGFVGAFLIGLFVFTLTRSIHR